jgi:hypothetical protein
MISQMVALRVPSADRIDGNLSLRGLAYLWQIHSIGAFSEPFLLSAQSPKACGPLREENR